jgi:hypothetical protein
VTHIGRSLFSLASRYQAHLIGMHVYPSVPAAPIAVPMQRRCLAPLQQASARRPRRLQRRSLGRRPISRLVAEWRALKVPIVDLALAVLDHARFVDLIIAGQTDPDWEQSPLMDFPERLAIESGRPVPLWRDRPQCRDCVERSSRIGTRGLRCPASPRRRVWTFLESRSGGTEATGSPLTPRLRLRSRAIASKPPFARRSRSTSARR